jgi:thymidylate synthase
MLHNFVYDDVSEALPDLLVRLEEADEVSSRGGLTKELTHVSVTLLKPWRREVLVPGRKPNLAAQIAETMWVLQGRDDIGWLSHYLPRAKEFSDDGKAWRAGYGKRLRGWPRKGETGSVDQIRYILETLGSSHLSRQAVATIWDPQIDTEPGKDIPCNNWLSFSSRLGYLDLTVAVRSNDVIWGWSGINTFEWSALQEVLAGLLGLKVGILNFVQTSLHLYSRHWGKAEKIIENHRQMFHLRPGKNSPRFEAGACRDLDGFDNLCYLWFSLEESIRNGYMSEDQVNSFPEPMLRSWLHVIQWWWSKNDRYLSPLLGTALELAARMSVQPTLPKPVSITSLGGLSKVEIPRLDFYPSSFMKSAIKLHSEKHEAYGDSWKRRGETLGILANIARKVDRLGASETSDETSVDTATDLMIYLAKYRAWLAGENTDDPTSANDLLLLVDDKSNDWSQTEGTESEKLEDFLRERFEDLEQRVVKDEPRFELVDDMFVVAYVLAKRLWDEDQSEYRGADHD